MRTAAAANAALAALAPLAASALTLELPPLTAPLADREPGDPGVAAKHPAIHVNDVSRRSGVRAQCANDVAIVAVRNKTDVLALRLLGHADAGPNRGLTRLFLGEPPQWKAKPFELCAAGGKQEVALVL